MAPSVRSIRGIVTTQRRPKVRAYKRQQVAARRKLREKGKKGLDA